VVNAPRANLTLPARLGRFELLSLLGVGGMATVYLARAHGIHGFERQVALKLMHPHLHLDATWTGQFLAEATIAAGILHPNVVRVTDVGDDDAGLYLVMDYVEGDSLAGLMKEAAARGERIPLGVGLRILADALAGLHAAHELRSAEGVPLDLVHRDFSPHNVLVGTDGIARLSDFGIAKTSLGDQTRSGVVKGKLLYMSPEQLTQKPLDRRTDVWAAGVMGWEVVTGARMHPAHQDEMAVMVHITSSVPPRASTVRPDLAREIDDAIATALAPAVADRLPTAEAFRALLLDTGLVADHEEVARYVAGAADARVMRLRELAGIRVPQVQPAPTESLSPAAAATVEMTLETRVDPAPRRGSRRSLVYVVAGVVAAAVGGLTFLRASAGRPIATAASSASAGPPAATAPPTAAEAPPSETPAPSTSAAPAGMSVAAQTTGSSAPLPRSVARPPRAHPTPSRLASPAVPQAPARKPLLADPLDAR
jgi:serine/threonine-protein kinase